jgi:uncharacterized protein YqeY
MALKRAIEDDLKAALLSGDRFVTETLRGLKAAILNEEVAQNKREDGLDDATIETIVAKEVKKRAEAAQLYMQNGRQESADDEQREAEIIGKYLPAQLSHDELRSIIDAAIAQLGATGMSDMGKVIGVVKSKVGNTADGATVAQLVKAALI